MCFAEEAKANAPCVIFIDELDSVGGKRIESPIHPHSRQTINQLLAEMDGSVLVKLNRVISGVDTLNLQLLMFRFALLQI